MTQDYKDILLRYLTGNIDEQSGVNEPLFNTQVESLNKNVAQNINDNLIANQNASSVVILGKIYNELYNNNLIYGYYNDTSNNYYGFIYITDDELNEVQMITEFASGTKLYPITALNQDENNNLYGLTSDWYLGETVTTRILLLNNIFASGLLDGNYKAILRKSYIIPYQYEQHYFRQNSIIKSLDSATYYIVLEDTSPVLTKIIKFVINVGSQNEWEEYSLTSVFRSQFYITTDLSSGDEVVLFYGVDRSNPAVYYEYSIDNGVVNTVKTINLSQSASAFVTQVFVKDANNVYIYTEQGSRGIIYKVNGNQLTEIFQTQESTYLITVYLFNINGGLFFEEAYKDSNGTTIYMGYIKEDNSYTIEEITTYTGDSLTPSVYGYTDFYYKSIYNLVNFYVPVYSSTNSTVKITFDYNSINYNGNEYENISSLLPVKGRLYDDNDMMIFARNLYNKTINANTTVSTINVPNTLLNDKTIATEKLIGDTNYELFNNQQNITKNIYENLNINFYSTITMVNKNYYNPIFSQIGSSRINLSVSKDLDYTDAQVGKIRINYQDGTNTISYLNKPTYDNGTYTYEFIIYVSKPITNIEIISNDENTTYQTITGNYDTNKYYKITQDVYVE